MIIQPPKPKMSELAERVMENEYRRHVLVHYKPGQFGKITDDQVRRIRVSKETAEVIAAKFKISKQYARRIRSGTARKECP